MSKLNIDLSQYIVNRVEKNNGITTGVSIRKDQKKFIDENSINLSALVRDFLDEVMKINEQNSPIKPKKNKAA